MGTPSYMRSVVDRNVVTRRMTVSVIDKTEGIFRLEKDTFLSTVIIF